MANLFIFWTFILYFNVSFFNLSYISISSKKKYIISSLKNLLSKYLFKLKIKKSS